MSIKECHIVIDGLDKTGKSTIRDLIIKKTNGKVLVIVRAELSQIIYSRINNRNINEQYFLNNIYVNQIDQGWCYFLLTASDEVIKERCRLNDEQDITVDDVEQHKKEFEKLIAELDWSINVNIIDTSVDTPEQSADKILKILKEKNE